MDNVKIELNDGSIISVPRYTTYYEISKFQKGNFPFVCALVNNKAYSLWDRVSSDEKVIFLDFTSAPGNQIYESGIKMIFEYAAKRVNKSFKVEYSYSLPKGIIARIKYDKILNDDEGKEIANEFSKVVENNLPIEKLVVKSSDAIDFYEKNNETIKAHNIKNIINQTVTLYKLDNLINYYYTLMPYSTSIINTYDIMYYGYNYFYINFPNEYDNGQIKKISDYRKIMETYIINGDFLHQMNVQYIKDINDEVSNGTVGSFIRSCELGFNLEINDTASRICRDKEVKFVMISGPSSSGKTTVTKRLANYFELYGKDPIVISLDDYFKNREDSPKLPNGDYDFESIETIDLDYLRKEMDKLLHGEEIILPKFNFVTGLREISSRKVKLKKNSILLFEGLHAINNDLLPKIPDKYKYKIFVSPFIPLSIDDQNYIPSVALRLFRRITRDFNTRGYLPDHTLKSNSRVRKGEENYVNPLMSSADRIINTALPYEVGVLKVYLEPLLYSLDKSSPYYNVARSLLNYLKQFFTISSELVPKDSILREFIGGGNND